jgi:hypothetical protein
LTQNDLEREVLGVESGDLKRTSTKSVKNRSVIVEKRDTVGVIGGIVTVTGIGIGARIGTEGVKECFLYRTCIATR